MDGSNVVLKFLVGTCKERQVQHIKNARAFAFVDCPLLVRYFDAFQCENGMVSLELEDVRESIPIDWWPSIPLPDLHRIFGEFARCIDNFHAAELIHRNIQPSHLLVGQDLKVCGFGLSLDLTQSDWLSTKNFGSIKFLPPEAKSGKWGRTSDQWALAKTYQHLRENHGRNLRFDETLTKGESKAILIATRPKPDMRYSSCVEFVDELCFFG